MRTIAANKKANYDFTIKEKFEAGLVLTGSEIKSLRVNTGSIKEAYIIEKQGELWLTNCFIKKYSSSINKDYNSTRARKLLVNKRELNIIISSFKRKGMTIVPLLLYLDDRGLAKISVGLGKGKKKYDKRAEIKTKEWDIQKQRLEKNRNI